MTTTHEQDVINVVIDGQDPGFIWQFNDPIAARGLAISAELDRDGYFQVFWTTDACRVFSEDCSAMVPFSAGQREASIPFPIRAAIRELRLDLPGTPGARATVRSLKLLELPEASSPWEGSRTTEVQLTSDGLHVKDSTNDPWIVSAPMPFEAKLVDTLEVQLAGPEKARPQFFWTNQACPNFAEECSLLLHPSDGTSTAQWLALEEHPNWTGLIRQLRLDPGDVAGDYEIHRIALRTLSEP